MKSELKSLKHNGIYVPPCEYKGFSIKIKGQTVKLSPKSEQMAIAWVKKLQSATPPVQSFLHQLYSRFYWATEVGKSILKFFLNLLFLNT